MGPLAFRRLILARVPLQCTTAFRLPDNRPAMGCGPRPPGGDHPSPVVGSWHAWVRAPPVGGRTVVYLSDHETPPRAARAVPPFALSTAIARAPKSSLSTGPLPLFLVRSAHQPAIHPRRRRQEGHWVFFALHLLFGGMCVCVVAEGQGTPPTIFGLRQPATEARPPNLWETRWGDVVQHTPEACLRWKDRMLPSYATQHHPVYAQRLWEAKHVALDRFRANDASRSHVCDGRRSS